MMSRYGAMGIGLAMICWMGVSAAETGRAVISPTTEGSTVSGEVNFVDSEDGLRVVVHIANAPPGDHGFHIHEFGDCGNSGNAAGGHYNPLGVKHGQVLVDGLHAAHIGDLGNITVGPDGTAERELILPGLSVSLYMEPQRASIAGPSFRHPVAGRTVILHEKPDDFSQPLGNAGGRIGCGSIVITKT